MMDDQLKKEIREQQKKIETLEKAKKDYEAFLEERHELENEISSLKTILDKIWINHYGEKEELKRKELEEKANGKEQAITDLKNKKRMRDELIDEIEHSGEPDIEKLKEELEQKILSSEQIDSSVYEKILEEKKRKEALLITLKELYLEYQKLYDHLATAVATRKEAFGRGLVNYVFGPNPNFVISKNLDEAKESGIKLLALLEDAGLPEIIMETVPLLNELVEEAKKPWSFGSFTRVYYPIFEKISNYFNALEIAVKRLEVEVDEKKAQIRRWIKAY